jgi:hypothetical protein
MSNGVQASGERQSRTSGQKKGPAAGERAEVADPVPAYGIFALGVCLSLLAIVTFYCLVATWPVPVADPKGGFGEFSIFWFESFNPTAPDLRLFITVIAAGALGSLIHSLTSFADYVGNRKLGKSWIWWLILRTPIGIALALLFYLVLRGGLIVPALSSGNSGTNSTQFLNPYGIAAISAMAGMFSKQATDKLREIFDTLFRTQEPVQRADPLSKAIPIISSTNPDKLTVGAVVQLTINGNDFQPDCKVTVNGKTRVAERVSDSVIKVTLLAEDVANRGELQLVVENPDPDGGPSEAFPITVD